MTSLQSCFFKVFEARRKCPFRRVIFRALGLLFKAGVKSRHFAFDRGWRLSYAPSIPVISVGNIAVGGTGKTPLVKLLCQLFEKEGKVGVLSRGFKAGHKKGILQISQGKGPLFSQQMCGDEPFFLAENSRASIWIGKDRICSAKLAEQEGVSLLILDDGMQHRRLARDVEIVVIDATDPLGEGQFLPSGKLREDPKRLFFADLIVLTHVKDEAHYTQVSTLLTKYTSAPCVGAQYLCKTVLEPGLKAAVFCGIGNPQHFLNMVRTLGVDLVETLILPDHDAPSVQKLKAFAQKSCVKGASCLLCTEKDAVKLSSFPKLEIPILPVGVELEIVYGKEHWNAMIEKVKKQVVRDM